MKEEQFGQPVIAVVNSFTQFVPGHVHLHEIGQQIKEWIAEEGCFAAEFNTIAIDDGIAMGHDGMLYSLPSRDLIADSVEYMCNAHKVDAMICISNCDKITPGMLMAAMRLNIPAVFVSGGRTARRPRLRPDRRDGQGSRQGFFGRRFVETRTRRLSDLRFVLRYVYRQLDELSDRGAGTLAAR